MALALFQRATGRELWHPALPGQACDKATRDALLDLEDAGTARPDGWARGRKLWCLTRAGREEAAGFLPGGTKLSTVREGESAGYDEHALDVVTLAGHLTRLAAAPRSPSHRGPPPGARPHADLVWRVPGASVPVLLVEVDRDTRRWATSPSAPAPRRVRPTRSGHRVRQLGPVHDLGATLLLDRDRVRELTAFLRGLVREGTSRTVGSRKWTPKAGISAGGGGPGVGRSAVGR
ncbi:hypothetical protein [Streptomyces sp. NRRL S-350]|uniref:hypothetical protein n=1 Tax=Streptomyces sp. NRRL S-350 TaxID=1463902 RepID=UPI0004C0DE17|nr:hypothetical protein [Streptomyces sp. NRRL S-350]